MADNDLKDRVLACAIEIWFGDPRGSSSSEVSRSVDVDHDDVKNAMLSLEVDGKGRVKRNVKLYEVSFDLTTEENEWEPKEINVHIFFPTPDALKAAYYASDLAKSEPPEYKKRLHFGASQIGQVFFSEDVLERYFRYPQYYEVSDTMSGGDVLSTPEASPDRYIHVRYGKVRLVDDSIAVAVIYSDLGDMAGSEQNHWKAHELPVADLDTDDRHYHQFLKQTYLGEFVEFADPISDVLKQVSAFNDAIGGAPVLTVQRNIDLRALYVVKVFRTNDC